MALRADDVDLSRDRALVEQFQAGDNRAFDDLYRRYFPRLYRFCLKRVGDAYEAEELAQEAFTRAYRHLDALSGDRRFYPWMTVIAGRLCIDTHRRRARSQPADDIDLGAIDGGQEAVLDAVDIATLRDAIHHLSPRHREVLDLRERQGLSYQSIAEHYGVSLGTVEALLWRARKALRREFLSIVDGDVPAIAVPAAGAGLSRLAWWRYRVGAWVHQHAQPLAAGAAAAVTAAAMGLGTAPPAMATAQAVTAHLSVTQAGRSLPAVAPAMAPALPVPSSTLAATTRTVAGATRAVDRAVTPYQDLQRQIARDPVHTAAGPVQVGVNAPAAVRDLSHDVTAVVPLPAIGASR